MKKMIVTADNYHVSVLLKESVGGLDIQPKKTNNPRRRIDGAAALLDAYTVFLQKEEAYRNVI